LKTASFSAHQLLDVLERKNMLMAEDYIDEGMRTLKAAKEKLLFIVNSYFSELE